MRAARDEGRARIIGLSAVGAFAAATGEKLLEGVSDARLVIAAVAAAVFVAWVFRRQRRPGAFETMRLAVGIALVGAVAGTGGGRLYDRAPGVLIALGVAGAVLLLAWWWRRGGRAGH